MKKLLKCLMKFSPVALTRNQFYDRLTLKIIKKTLKKDTNCIDVGSHEGEFLKLFLKYSPAGTHYAFEPLPDFFHNLQQKFSPQGCQIFNIALSNAQGETEFTHVVSNPAYSGFRERTYEHENEVTKKIKVATNSLDEIIPPDVKTGFIKIDVEGAELGVFLGAQRVIEQSKPVIVFEHGLGAADHYNTSPIDIHSLLNNLGMNIFTLKSFLRGGKNLTSEEMQNLFNTGKEYYFVAAPLH
jgi:FkbM family methyltransferase